MTASNQLFGSFIEAVYISKDKKIAVVLKLDDSNYLSKHNGSHDYVLVEQISNDANQIHISHKGLYLKLDITLNP